MTTTHNTTAVTTPASSTTPTSSPAKQAKPIKTGTGSTPLGRVRRLGRGGMNVAGIVLAILWAFPVYWMVNSSLQSDETLYGEVPQFFPDWDFSNYSTVTSDPSFWAAMQVSAIVTVMSVVAALFSAFLAAIALSRFRFRSRRTLVIAVLVIQMIPAEALFISQYRMLDGWGMIDNVLGLSLLYAGHSIPITIWMLKGFVDGIPIELEEAAMMDGCSRFGAFMRITFPLLAPGMVASGIFALLASWNEYTLALVIMKNNSSATLPLWLKRFNVSYEATDWGGIMAGSTLIAIPVIIVFLIVQGRMATGLVAGAVKG
jgi:N,N'-diacetylchitobiose transport system permease protein